MKPTLIHLLERFNRKERYFLVGHALGNPRFQLSYEFRRQLAATLDVPVPIDASCWMDYHLDWIYAALVLFRAEGGVRDFKSPEFPRENPDEPPFNVNENQEDIDLLVAFETGTTTHLALIEAKGVARFGNRQLESKGRRLGLIFGESGKKHDDIGVRPYFLIASPVEPRMRSETGTKGLTSKGIPSWMIQEDGKYNWLELPVPGNRIVVERTDEDGNSSRLGQRWHLKSDGPTSPLEAK